jgi:hypothetical protein
VDVRIEVALSVDAEIFAQDLQGQPAVFISAPGSLGGRHEIDTGDFLFHHRQKFFAVGIEGVRVAGISGKAVDNVRAQPGALVNSFLAP